MEPLKQILMNSIVGKDYAVRIYRKSDIGSVNYEGERLFLPLVDVCGATKSDVGAIVQSLEVMQNQAKTDHEMLQGLATLPRLPEITVSVDAPTSPASKHIWVELYSSGQAKNLWIRRGTQWFTLYPMQVSFTTGLISALLKQELPIDLPMGCKSLYFDRFQAVLYVVSKLGSLLGYNIAPKYIDQAGLTQSFAVSAISTVSYPANAPQAPAPIVLNTTLTITTVSALAVAFEPIGIPGSIRVNGTFTYYGIRE